MQPWFQNNVAFYVSYFWLYRMLTLGQIRLNWIQWNKRKKTWNLLIILKSYHSVCWIHRQVQLNDAKHQWMSLQWRKSWNNKWHMDRRKPRFVSCENVLFSVLLYIKQKQATESVFYPIWKWRWQWCFQKASFIFFFHVFITFRMESFVLS